MNTPTAYQPVPGEPVNPRLDTTRVQRLQQIILSLDYVTDERKGLRKTIQRLKVEEDALLTREIELNKERKQLMREPHP